MRKFLVMVVSIFLLLSSSFAYSQVPEWHSELVLKVPFGDGQGEFAASRDSKGMEYFIGEASDFVWSYYVDSTRVYIADAYRVEVKIYELGSGRFVKAIPLLRPLSNRREPGDKLWGAEDMMVLRDTLYILLSTSMIPPPGISYYSIYTYDIRSGKPLKRHRIYNSWIGTNPKFTKYPPTQYGGVTFLSLGEDSDIYVYDRARHKSFKIFSHGKPTPKEEHAFGVTGRVCGRRRYYWNGKAGQTLVLSGMSGESVSRTIPSSWYVISPDGGYLLTYSRESNADDRVSIFYIYRYDGVPVGRITIDYRGRRTQIGGMGYGKGGFFVSNDGCVYELGVYDDGVYLYRWVR